MGYIPHENRNLTGLNLGSQYNYLFYLSHSFCAPLPTSKLTRILESQLEEISNKEGWFFQHYSPTVNDLLRGFPPVFKAQVTKDVEGLKKKGVYISNTDKNLMLVALPLDYDIRHCQKILSNGLFKPITKGDKDRFLDNAIRDVKEVVDEFIKLEVLNKGHKSLIYKYLFERHIPKLKPLPKIHKNRPIWNDPPARPVIGAFNAYNKGISKVIHKFIFPVLMDMNVELGSPFCLSSYQLVDDLKNIDITKEDLIPEGLFGHGIVILTGDFDQLYNRIKISEAITGIGRLWDTNPRKFNHKTWLCLKNLLPFIFHTIVKNRHDESFHEAENLLAMGTDCAPAVAYVSLLTLDQSIKNLSPNILYYRRYIDDVIIILKGIRCYDNILDLFHLINQNVPAHHKINWGTNFDAENFLDLMIGFDPFTLSFQTNIVRKFNCLPLYLSPASTHPPKMLQGIVLGQIQRSADEVSSQPFFREQLAYICKAAISLQYPENCLKELLYIMEHDVPKDVVLRAFTDYKTSNPKAFPENSKFTLLRFDHYRHSLLRSNLEDIIVPVWTVNKHFFS